MTVSWAPLKKTWSAGRAHHREGVPSSEPIDVAQPAPSTCRVTTKAQVGVTAFALQGECDAGAASELRIMLAAAVGVAEVLLDLTDVLALNVEGVDVLRYVIGRVHEHGGQVAISRPWRLSTKVSALVGTEGLTFLSLSPAAAIAWLAEHPLVDTTVGGHGADTQSWPGVASRVPTAQVATACISPLKV